MITYYWHPLSFLFSKFRETSVYMLGGVVYGTEYYLIVFNYDFRSNNTLSIVQHVNLCIYGLFVLFGQLVCMFLLVFWILVPLFLKALEGKSAYASVCLWDFKMPSQCLSNEEGQEQCQQKESGCFIFPFIISLNKTWVISNRPIKTLYKSVQLYLQPFPSAILGRA